MKPILEYIVQISSEDDFIGSSSSSSWSWLCVCTAALLMRLVRPYFSHDTNPRSIRALDLFLYRVDQKIDLIWPYIGHSEFPFPKDQ